MCGVFERKEIYDLWELKNIIYARDVPLKMVNFTTEV